MRKCQLIMICILIVAISKAQDSTLKHFPSERIPWILEKLKLHQLNKTQLPSVSVPIINSPYPFLKFNGGTVGYNGIYRSIIDTLYADRNIVQHQLVSSLNFTIANIVPVRFNAFVSKSNSTVFRDITDFQLQFDAAAYRNNIRKGLNNKLLKQGFAIKDSLAQQLLLLKQLDLKKLKSWLDNPLTGQKLIEANEIIKVPGITYDMSLPDSVNLRQADSMKLLASTFIESYNQTKGKYNAILNQADSLKIAYENSIKRFKEYQDLVSKPEFGNLKSYATWKNKLQEYLPQAPDISKKDLWLLGVRNMALGKSAVSTSELTAKNISVTGINFEYNSWYYLGVVAGLVEYRFNDFINRQFKRTPQYLYMLRLGLGSLEKNYFIVSAFSGQKQLYTSTSEARKYAALKTTGLSAEAKWRVQNHTYLIAEVAQSLSPDFRTLPVKTNNSWDLSDKSNKAASIKLYSFIPQTNSRLDIQYRFTGANYQAFNSFQTNAAVKNWNVKGEQKFFGRKLRLLASLSTNDFSNPYITQHYKSNTVFKTLSATFQSKNLPVVSVGYMPVSQLIKLGEELAESRFQTFNVSVNHFYKIGEPRASASFMYSKFFNDKIDTGFIYYNATNLYAGQSIFFTGFSVNTSIAYSKSLGYIYTVLEQGLSVPVSKSVNIGSSVKVNKLNQQEIKTGAAINGDFLISQKDVLSFRVEKGYLPGSGNLLIHNTIGNISFVKTIR